MLKIWNRAALLFCIAAANAYEIAPVVCSDAAAVSSNFIIQFGGPLGNTYSPSEISIQPGDTVEWQGVFSSHPLMSDEGLWTTPSTGTVFTHIFPTTGTFRFHCLFHGQAGGVGMSGRVIVRELPIQSTTTTLSNTTTTLPASGGTTLQLNNRRFLVTVNWVNYNDGNRGAGQAVGLTSDSGYFWFFNAANVELIVKVLDGRPINGKFWVLFGALSDVEYTLTVTDSQTGTVKTYNNPAHTLASRADVNAF